MASKCYFMFSAFDSHVKVIVLKLSVLKLDNCDMIVSCCILNIVGKREPRT